MREIKFRGMDANGVMRYGRLSQDKENETAYYRKYSQRICCDNSNIPVSNETLGQSTGFKDKNDKEIYTGDIVKEISTGDLGVVYFIAPAYIAVDKNRDQFLIGAGVSYPPYKNELHDMEVIGNIYENKELLEVQK